LHPEYPHAMNVFAVHNGGAGADVTGTLRGAPGFVNLGVAGWRGVLLHAPLSGGFA